MMRVAGPCVLFLVTCRLAGAQGGNWDDPQAARGFFEEAGLFERASAKRYLFRKVYKDLTEADEKELGGLGQDFAGHVRRLQELQERRSTTVLTMTGKLLYEYLSDGRAAGELQTRMGEFDRVFGALAGKSCTDSRREAMNREIKETSESLFTGSETRSSSPERTLMLNACLHAALDEAAAMGPSLEEYIPMELNEIFAYMDHDGVAARASKLMLCRHKGWPKHAEPLVLSLKGFSKFKREHVEYGDWNRWTCVASPGEIEWDRETLKRQKEMNKALPETEEFQDRRMPETGMLNCEMLLYHECRLRLKYKWIHLAYLAERIGSLARLYNMGLEPRSILHGDRYAGKLQGELEKKARKDLLPKDAPTLLETGPRPRTILEYVDSVMAPATASIDRIGAARGALRGRISRFEGNSPSPTRSEYEALMIEMRLVEQDLAGALLKLQQAQAITRMKPLRFDFHIKRVLDGYEGNFRGKN